MKDLSRSIRRHHLERLKKLRRNYWGMNRNPEIRTPERLARVAQTPACCSCWCCGNPRKYFKTNDALTVQEHRAMQAFKKIEQL